MLPAASSSPVPAPTGAGGIARQLGPGLIITACIVGSGELIVTPKLGASAGFSLLWFIVLGCLIKVFVQIELGRHAVAHGQTTLSALDGLPGPRLRVSWVLWLWLLMYLGLVFQVAGMVGGVASIFTIAALPLSVPTTAVLVGASCALLLVVGRYRFIESVSTALVAAFTLTTVVAVVALQTTPYAVTSAQLFDGFRFHLPPSFNVTFAAFGIIGVGASELIYCPLVLVGAIGQGLMLPFLAFAALHFHYVQTDPALRPGGTFAFCLVLSAGAIAAAGIYQVAQQLRGLLP